MGIRRILGLGGNSLSGGIYAVWSFRESYGRDSNSSRHGDFVRLRADYQSTGEEFLCRILTMNGKSGVVPIPIMVSQPQVNIWDSICPTRTGIEFFQSGVELTKVVFPIIEKHFRENWTPKVAVDFGCGVGRLAIPLAKRCQRVIGIDVSEAMLRETRANAEKTGTANIEFIKGDDGLTLLSKPFDYFQSFHVFQHIPVTRGMRILQQLVTHLQPEGVGIVHVPFLDRKSVV